MPLSFVPVFIGTQQRQKGGEAADNLYANAIGLYKTIYTLVRPEINEMALSATVKRVWVSGVMIYVLKSCYVVAEAERPTYCLATVRYPVNRGVLELSVTFTKIMSSKIVNPA